VATDRYPAHQGDRLVRRWPDPTNAFL